jgi:hypothetical protein
MEIIMEKNKPEPPKVGWKIIPTVAVDGTEYLDLFWLLENP